LAGTMFTLLPYQLVQLTSIPIGAAMVWLGYALFSERRGKPAESLLDQGIVSRKPSTLAWEPANLSKELRDESDHPK